MSREVWRFPPSFAQQRLWFLAQLEPNSSFYNIPVAMRLRGPLRLEALEKSLNEMIRRHESLRTSFATIDGRPLQEVTQPGELALTLVDLTATPQAEREGTLSQTLMREAQKPFNLISGPLLRITIVRLGDNEHVFLLTIHHIITDGWSLKLFFEELGALYDAFTRDEASPLPEPSLQYVDYADWQQRWLRDQVLEDQLAYWRQHLDGAPSMIDLPTDRPRPLVQSFDGARHHLKLSPQLAVQLKRLSQQRGVTMFMLLLAAFETLLHRYSGQTDIVVGSPIANRNRAEVEHILGLFANTVALRTNFSGDPIFTELLDQVRDVTLGAHAHQDAPFEKLIEALKPERSLTHSPLFQVMFDFQTDSIYSLELDGLEVTPVLLDRHTAMFDLNLSFRDQPDGPVGVCDYRTDLFEAETIARMMRHFETLLAGIAANPERRVSELPLISAAEREELIHVLSGARKAQHSSSLTADLVHVLFERNAAQSPSSLALICGTDQYTFAEVNSRANRLARYLRGRGAGPEVLVGVCLERGPELLIALLAVLKSGAAYVPLDPAYPELRISFIVTDSDMKLLLTTSDLLHKLPRGVEKICVDQEAISTGIQSDENVNALVSPKNAAYVIYTSGSTGEPKGVVVSHGALASHTHAIANEYCLNENDRVLQFASISFDVAAEEIFPTWCSGATVVLSGSQSLPTIAEFLSLVESSGITVVNLPAVYWHQWAAELARSLLPLPSSLRLVITGNEKVMPERYKSWREWVGDTLTWKNAYGPTETTITATIYTPPVTFEFAGHDAMPIGRPLVDRSVYILDSNLQPAPIGLAGEIYIAGQSLARGYLNQPALTAKNFVPHPFASEPGERLYRTGDRARFLAGGNIEFVGRTDEQLKIRGYRIEPGEVELALRQNPQVRDAIIVAREDNPGDRRLVAYVIPIHTPAQVELWPSVGEYPVYDEILYHAMTNDQLRNRSYRNAISRLVKDKLVVEIGTGKDLVLSRFCLEAGAKKVYAIEAMDEPFQLARETANKLGFQYKLVLIHGNSRTLELPEQVDICVSEIIGTIGGSEGVATVLNDARRFLKPDGIMIPLRCTTKIAAVRLDDQVLANPRFADLPRYYVERVFEQMGHEFDVRLCLKNFDSENLISDAQVFEELDFTGSAQQEFERTLNFTITQDGRLDGFLLWINLETTPGELIDTLAQQYSWLPVFFPAFYPGVQVSSGDEIRARCSARLSSNGVNPDYRIEGNVIRRDGQTFPFCFDSLYESTSFKAGFYERLFAEKPAGEIPGELSASTLKRDLSEKLPAYMVPSSYVFLKEIPLTTSGKIDRQALPAPVAVSTEQKSTYVAPRNTTEEILAEIWAQVLGLERVSVHANFFELGGDSILSIQIISRANEVGLHLTPNHMFRYQTVAELAPVATIARVKTAEQGIVSGSVPLTPIQHWFWEQRMPAPHHYNQAMMLELRRKPDPALLKQAIDSLLMHHDVLRARYVGTDARRQQVIEADANGKVFAVEDLSSSPQSEYTSVIETRAAEFQQTLDLSEGPLARFVLFKLRDETPDRLLIIVHHLVVDAVSWRMLLEDLQTAYEQLEHKTKVRLPPKTTSFKQWAEKLVASARAGEFDRELNYWLAADRQNVRSLPVDCRGAAPTVCNSRRVSVSLTKDETSALLQEVPATFRTQISDALLTALVMAFAKWTGERQLLVDLESHGREEFAEDLDLSRTVAWFTSVYPVLLKISAENPGKSLQEIKQQLRGVPGRGLGYGVLAFLDNERGSAQKLRSLPQPEVSFNYLGQFDQVFPAASLFAGATESTGPWRDGTQPQSHLIAVDGMVRAGRLQFDWTFSRERYHVETIEKLAQAFSDNLRALIESCRLPESGSFAPEDFAEVDLSDDQLQKVLEEMGLVGES